MSQEVNTIQFFPYFSRFGKKLFFIRKYLEINSSNPPKIRIIYWLTNEFKILDTKDAVIHCNVFSILFRKYFESAYPKNTIPIYFIAITFELKTTTTAVAGSKPLPLYLSHCSTLCRFCAVQSTSTAPMAAMESSESQKCTEYVKNNQKDLHSSYLDILIKPSNENPF